ncbi:MAG: hypothetical protein U1E53_08315 [Dongiaceae bacterium]
MTRFVLLSLPRSGTVLVRTMLSQHPEARCFGEIFDANYLAAELPRDIGAGDRVEAGRLLLADRIAFTERHCFGPPGAAPAATGFALMLQQPMRLGLAERVWGWLSAMPDLRVIRLERENELLRYASFLRALQTGEWSRTDGPVGPAPPVQVAPEAFLAHLRLVRALGAQVEARLAHLPTLRVGYEALAADPVATVAGIFRFLGLEPVVPRIATARQSPRDLAGSIANLDELRRRLSGTPQARWLEPEPAAGRVAIVSSAIRSPDAGAAAWSARAAMSLRRHGHRVTLVCVPPLGTAVEPAAQAGWARRGVELEVVERTGAGEAEDAIRVLGERVMARLAERALDIVHLPAAGALGVLATAARRQGHGFARTAFAVTPHDGEEREGEADPALAHAERQQAEAADALLSPALDPGPAERDWLAWHDGWIERLRRDLVPPEPAPSVSALLAPGARRLRRDDGGALEQVAVEPGGGEPLALAVNRAALQARHPLLLLCLPGARCAPWAPAVMAATAARLGADAAVSGRRADGARPAWHPPCGPLALAAGTDLFGDGPVLVRAAVFHRLGGLRPLPALAGFELRDLLNRLLLQGGRIAAVPYALYRSAGPPVPDAAAQQALRAPFGG